MSLEDRDYMRDRQRKTNARVRRQDRWARVPWWLREWVRVALLFTVLGLAWQGWKLLR